MIYIKVIFAAFLLISTSLSATEYNREVNRLNKSYTYLNDNVIYFDFKSVDVNLAEHHLNILNDFLLRYKLPISEESSIRETRARSYHVINNLRAVKEEHIDGEQATMAIDDILFVLKNTNNKKRVPNLHYYSGLIIQHLSNDLERAFEHYEKCALTEHAGCMNILANSMFHGINNQTRDLRKSVHWHKKIYATGLDYRCAGIYSANSIKKITFHFPDLFPQERWSDWFKNSNNLIDEINKDKNMTYCGNKSESYILDYVFFALSGKNKEGLLKKAIELAQSSQQKEIYSSLLYNKNLGKVVEYLKEKEIQTHTAPCLDTFSFMLLSKYQKKINLFNNLEQYFYSLSSKTCRQETTFIELLQESGKW